ncbi:hypothetical protein EV383_1828 [Pseudonocardia sediminis]|uniref:Uncharacterized protein n=1 Tax=Pseudonocardia sediminis TaxID=1397368 RepID=A0A4Q7USV8_PSEST|nr:hypothetical protein [Pseudonocardia sediminis]RZT84967.1 hypothetical protein EV383_1828 [Pseudonocardia sediminis]
MAVQANATPHPEPDEELPPLPPQRTTLELPDDEIPDLAEAEVPPLPSDEIPSLQERPDPDAPRGPGDEPSVERDAATE